MDSVSSSVLFSFSENNLETNVLREKAILMANCFVLANYDINREESYQTDQIKVDWEKRLLVNTSSFDLSNHLSKYSKGWIEPLTDLDKTVIILRSICDKVFENANSLAQGLSEVEKKAGFLMEQLETLTVTAIFAFAGIMRMKATYSHRYAKMSEPYPPFVTLSNLSNEAQTRGKILIELFVKITGQNLRLKLANDSQSIEYIDKTTNTLEKTMSLKDINVHWISEQHYYESLFNLSSYNIQVTGSYKSHQVKAFEKTKLLALTSSWSVTNWVGSLTNLDKTVVILREHCNRARKQCERYSDVISKCFKPEDLFRNKTFKEVDAIIHHTFPGIRRMGTTYCSHYASNPNHPGLRELKECIDDLEWANKIKLDDEVDG